MAQRKTILVVDDDEELRGALAEQVELEADLRAEQAPTAQAGIAAAQIASPGGGPPDLILLDVDLPDMDGRDACRRMRELGVRAPVIMLTAAGADADAIRGLDAGANDYVVKPFRFAVLLARIRAQLRAHEQSENAVYRIGGFEFRPAQKLLIDQAQQKVRLTDKETSILRYLYRAGGKPVPREELLAEVWGYNAGVTTHTLETHVYRLRQKIEPESGGGAEVARLLITETGGYSLAV